MVALFLAFWGIAILFSILATLIYIPTNSIKIALSSTSSPVFIICRILIIVILTGVRLYFIVMICISLIISNAEYNFICLLAIYSYSLKKVYTGLMPIFFDWVVFSILSCFTVALITIFKIWIQPKHPSTDKWIKMWYVYTWWNIYSVIEKNEILPFAATWMKHAYWNEPEKDNHYMISLICRI